MKEINHNHTHSQMEEGNFPISVTLSAQTGIDEFVDYFKCQQRCDSRTFAG